MVSKREERNGVKQDLPEHVCHVRTPHRAHGGHLSLSLAIILEHSELDREAARNSEGWSEPIIPEGRPGVMKGQQQSSWYRSSSAA